MADPIRPHTRRRGVLAAVTRVRTMASQAATPSRKRQLLQQCARIGFTPPTPCSLSPVFIDRALLEVSPWPKNIRS